jgi:general stress protein 26
MSEELKNKITQLVKKYPLSVVATVSAGKPFARYMMLVCDEKLNFYSATALNSKKVAQVKDNKNVCAVIGADINDMNNPYAAIYGRAEISNNPELKKKIWCDHLKDYFKGPEDENYIVFKITPDYIEYMSPGKMEPEILKF